MWKYVLKRLLWMVAIVIGVAFVIFTILYFTPGDPAALMLGEEASMAERAELHTKLGLDDPYIVQLGRFLYDTFIRFDLGQSWLYHVDVMDELASRLRGLQCHVNLIPLNPVKERNLQAPPLKDQEAFMRRLEQKRISVTRRRALGSEIEGACGQLRRAREKQDKA